MKKINRAQAIGKFQSLEIKKTSVAFDAVSQFLGLTEGKRKLIEQGKIRTCLTDNSKRYARDKDYTFEIMDLFAKCGLVAELRNDAPRRGFAGNYLLITNLID